MVSWDCGMSYQMESESLNPDDFKARTEELDKQMIRWTIEDEAGQCHDKLCKIHKSILAFMLHANKKE